MDRRRVNLAGVTIADGCIVAAGPVVTKDVVAELSMARGVPTKAIVERIPAPSLPDTPEATAYRGRWTLKGCPGE
jgi:tetrahydrodipicolinate N-succinyltransferase